MPPKPSGTSSNDAPSFKGIALETSLTGGEGAIQNTIVKIASGLQGIMQKMMPEFNMGLDDYTPMGSIKYWDEITGYMSTTVQSLGIAGELGKSLKGSFQEAYPLVVEMGISAEDMSKTLNDFFTNTGRSMQMTKGDMAELAKMGKVFGAESIDIVSTYKTLGVSISTSTKRMREFVKDSDKLGILPTKAVKILKDNIDKVNQYGFKNGVKGLEQMALYAARTNSSMASAFSLADKVNEGGIEGAMEMASNLQLMGGAFANLGNPFELITKSRNDVEGLQQDLGKALATMGKMGEDGKVVFSPQQLHLLRNASKELGMDMKEITNFATSQVKELDISGVMANNLKSMDGFDSMLAKVSGAAEKNQFGDWEVAIDGVKKKVSDLQKEDIDKLSLSATGTKEDTFEQIATSNEKLAETMTRLNETIKTMALDPSGLAKVSEILKTGAGNVKDTIAPFLEAFKQNNAVAIENLLNVIRPLSEGNILGTAKAAANNVGDAVTDIAGIAGPILGEAGDILSNVGTNIGKYFYGSITLAFENAGRSFTNGLYGWYNNTIGNRIGLAVNIPSTKGRTMEDVIGEYKGLLDGTKTGEYLNQPENKTSATPNISSDDMKLLSDRISNIKDAPTKFDADNNTVVHVFEKITGEFTIINTKGEEIGKLTDAQMEQIVEALKKGWEGSLRTTTTNR
jgi:hypothetical protein